MGRYNKYQTQQYIHTHNAHTLGGGQYLAPLAPLSRCAEYRIKERKQIGLQYNYNYNAAVTSMKCVGTSLTSMNSLYSSAKYKLSTFLLCPVYSVSAR